MHFTKVLLRTDLIDALDSELVQHLTALVHDLLEDVNDSFLFVKHIVNLGVVVDAQSGESILSVTVCAEYLHLVQQFLKLFLRSLCRDETSHLIDNLLLNLDDVQLDCLLYTSDAADE